MDYKVIVASEKHEIEAVNKIEQQVKKYVDNGWKPLGGVSISRTDTLRTVIAQAMIKE